MSLDNFYVVGLDLGQAADYSALAVLERVPVVAGEPPRLDCRHLRRWSLGTSYPQIVRDVRSLVQGEPLWGNARLVVDATGVGRPVVDLLRQADLGCVLTPVVITGGSVVTRDGSWYFVPKKDLVASAQVALQSRRLRIAEGLDQARVLVEELLNYRVRVSVATGHESFDTWREGVHDDLVLALALAVWQAGRPRLPFV